MVLESGDADVQVSGRRGLPLVFLLEILLIVHVSLDIIRKGDLPVPAAQTLDAPLCLHCSWISWGQTLGSDLAPAWLAAALRTRRPAVPELPLLQNPPAFRLCG